MKGKVLHEMSSFLSQLPGKRHMMTVDIFFRFGHGNRGGCGLVRTARQKTFQKRASAVQGGSGNAKRYGLCSLDPFLLPFFLGGGKGNCNATVFLPSFPPMKYRFAASQYRALLRCVGGSKRRW